MRISRQLFPYILYRKYGLNNTVINEKKIEKPMYLIWIIHNKKPRRVSSSDSFQPDGENLRDFFDTFDQIIGGTLRTGKIDGDHDVSHVLDGN